MLLQVKHKTQYSYDNPVFLEPHYLSFYPLQRHYFEIKEFSVKVSPEPDGFHRMVDTANHLLHQVWYNQEISNFKIDVTILVETQPFNPFSFFVDKTSDYVNDANLEAYLEIQDNYSETLRKQVKILEDKSEDTLTLVNNILEVIHSGWGHEVRYDEAIHDPSECFDLKNGSCRDLSWMMIHMLRLSRVPSRFASGYSYNSELGEGHELHAWVEFYIPGAGWIGADPSAGIYTTHHYIPVSTSPNPKDTLPVSGSFRGKGNDHLKTTVEIIEI